MQSIGPYKLNTIVTGDARELAKEIPDESIDLIFTDPVYDRIEDYEWLAEMAERVLKPGGSILCYIAHQREIQIGIIMNKYLNPCPTLQEETFHRVGRLFQYSLQCDIRPVLWFCNGVPINKWMFIKTGNPMIPGSRKHVWGKNIAPIAYRISKFTDERDVLLDPFTGGGSIPIACKQMNRQYLAFEINPQTAELARQRVAETQPPLPMEMPEQMELGFETRL